MNSNIFAVKLRPLINREKGSIWSIDPSRTEIYTNGQKTIEYDHVFDTTCKQALVYDTCVRLLVKGCLYGRNGTVLAFGRARSGKTFTMGTDFTKLKTNTDHTQGIVPRALQQVFDEIQLMDQQSRENNQPVPTFKVTLQYLECYGEEIIDLLDENTQSSEFITIENNNGTFDVIKAKSRVVESSLEAFGFLWAASSSKTTKTSHIRDKRSGHHTILTLSVERSATNATEGLSAKLLFVELPTGLNPSNKRTVNAPNRLEHVNTPIDSGQVFLETFKSSLSGQTTESRSHLQLMLTRLFQHSLSRYSNTLVITCISKIKKDESETMVDLNRAREAWTINGKVIQDTAKSHLSRQPEEVQEDSELLELKRKYNSLRDNNDSLAMAKKSLEFELCKQAKSHKLVELALSYKEELCKHHENELKAQEMRIEELDVSLEEARQAKSESRRLIEILEHKSRDLNKNLTEEKIRLSVATKNLNEAHNRLEEVDSQRCSIVDEMEKMRKALEKLQSEVINYKQLLEEAEKTAKSSCIATRDGQEDINNDRDNHMSEKFSKPKRHLQMINSLVREVKRSKS